MTNSRLFTFAISLSVLDHLGRNLYRSFATVLGEAISNSWDADADNVWLYIDKEKNSFVIKDDGDGMTSDDFQNKFLKIGYSKRRKENKSRRGRYYIGRKGIGKLALLSCADRIHIISKIKNGQYVGGIIDNSGLNTAITEDLSTSDYPLEEYNLDIFGKHIENHEKGTILYFENIQEGIKHNLDFLRKIIALNFRFSLLDNSFNIFVDGKKVTLDDLNDLAQNTQFLWSINMPNDPYLKEQLTNLRKPEKKIAMDDEITGFIASVKKPRDLKIMDTEERVGIDLFVNGRVRETNILKRIPTARVAENYLYGQIHFNKLDDDKDRFTSNREAIIPNDEKFIKFLDNLKKKISEILEDWDKWRLAIKEEGDPENPRITRRERTSRGLYNAVSEEFVTSNGDPKDPSKKKVEDWVDALGDDATLNFASYAECFVSENLVRKHIQENSVSISQEAQTEIDMRKNNETQRKNEANISIDIRKMPNDMSYLSMDHLANLVDKSKDAHKDPGLSRDAKEYKPIRDALMHTALLTDEAKTKLNSVRANIKSRVKNLLSGK